MGALGAVDSSGQIRRASAHDQYARSNQCQLLPAAHELSVALSSPRGISAAFDRLQYLSQLPESWIFRNFQRAGVWDAIWEQLHMDLREDMGREASASAAIIDSQSVKSAEKGAVLTA